MLLSYHEEVFRSQDIVKKRWTKKTQFRKKKFSRESCNFSCNERKNGFNKLPNKIWKVIKIRKLFSFKNDRLIYNDTKYIQKKQSMTLVINQELLEIDLVAPL